MYIFSTPSAELLVANMDVGSTYGGSTLDYVILVTSPDGGSTLDYVIPIILCVSLDYIISEIKFFQLYRQSFELWPELNFMRWRHY
jgi:hypothetical protein